MALDINTLKPLKGVKETTIGKTVSVSFDSNYTQQRLKTSRFRKRFELEYMLTADEYVDFDELFQESLGLTVQFQHPLTLVIYDVYISGDELTANYIENNLVQVTIVFEEV